MRNIENVLDHPLEFIQPKIMKRDYELRFGDEVLAKVNIPKALNSLTEIITAEGKWILTCEGTFTKKIKLAHENNPASSLECRINPWTSKIFVDFPDGKKYHIKTNITKTSIEINKESGENVITFKTKGLFKKITRITFNRMNAIRAHISILVILGIYTEILNRREARHHVSAGYMYS